MFDLIYVASQIVGCRGASRRLDAARPQLSLLEPQRIIPKCQHGAAVLVTVADVPAIVQLAPIHVHSPAYVFALGRTSHHASLPALM